MQVTCPNLSCGKVLTVQEEYAGKKGKCPACGSELTIPAAPFGDAGRQGAGPRGRFGADDPAAALPAAPIVRPVEDDVGFDKRRGRSTAATSKPAAGVMTRLALAVGIGALCLLALSPRMHWIYISKPDKVVKPQPDLNVNVPESLEEEMLAERYLKQTLGGIDILHISLAVAALALVALMLTPTQERDLADGAIAASGSAAVCWGFVAGLWQLAIVWKIIKVANHYAEQKKPVGFQATDTSVYPGPGIGLGLLAAMVVVLVFAVLVLSRKRFLWALTASGMGFLLGLLLLVLHVKPWQEIR
jgi:hypothetical protein